MARTSMHVTMAEDGGVIIPQALRDALGMKGGDKLVARVENGALVMETIESAVKRVQAMVAQYVPEGVSLVDELIAERRAEAERE